MGKRRVIYFGGMSGAFPLHREAPVRVEQRYVPKPSFDEPRPSEHRLCLHGWVLLNGPNLAGLRSNRHEEVLSALQSQLDARGQSLLRELEGSFSAAYVTPHGGTLYLHRGITSRFPVYLRTVGSEVRWGSEVRSVLGEDFEKAELDPEIISSLLVLDCATPHRSIFRGVERLPAGCTLRLDQRGCRSMDREITRSGDNSQLSIAEVSETVRALMSSAMERMIAEGDDVIILYSGGLDSSITALESRNLGASVTAWTCAFREVPQLRQAEDHAAASAQGLGVRHVFADRSRLLASDSGYGDIVADAPIPSDPSLEFLLGVSSERPVEVGALMLSGTVVDALFNFEAIEVFLTHGWRVLNPFRARGRPWLLPRDVLAACLLGRLSSPEVPPFGDPVLREWMKPIAFESAQETLETQAASCADRYSGPAPGAYRALQHLVEMSSSAILSDGHADIGTIPIDPFLDRRLVDFCLSLGPRHRIQRAAGRGVTKAALRYAYRHDFPSATVRRSMNGPLDVVSHVFLRNNVAQAQFLLGNDSILADLGVIAPESLSSVLARVDDPVAARSSTTIVRAMSFERWLRKREGRDECMPSPEKATVRRTPTVLGKTPGVELDATEERVATLPPNVRLVTYDSLNLLLDSTTNFLLRLNGSGAAILLALLESSSWHQCFQRTSRQLGVPLARAGDEVIGIATDLQQRHILQLRIPIASAKTVLNEVAGVS